jgi:hypothetical protein
MARSISCFLIAVSILLLSASSSMAQVFNATVSTGYANIRTQRSDNLFYSHDGSYLDADFAWKLPVLPLYTGVGVGGSGYWDRQRIFGSTDSFDDRFNHLYSDLGTFEIEPRLALKLGGRRGLFVEPRIGAGLQVSSYGVDRLINDSNGNTFIDTVYHTGAAFEVHPAIQLGYSWGWGAAGVEGSYMYSWGNFGGFGRHAEEYRIGAFFRFNL